MRAGKPFAALPNIIVVLCAVLLSLVAAELLARFHYFMNGEAFFGRSHSENMKDPQKGWKATPLFAVQETLRDASGHSYNLVFHQDKEGFREFQDLGRRPRILVIGDSFTQDRYASDNKTWYAEIGKRLRAQVFAYGAAGYGTLQELMVLREFLERRRTGRAR